MLMTETSRCDVGWVYGTSLGGLLCRLFLCLITNFIFITLAYFGVSFRGFPGCDFGGFPGCDFVVFRGGFSGFPVFVAIS